MTTKGAIAKAEDNCRRVARLTTDLADRAIDNITSHVSIYPNRPFFLFWAPSAMHSPHQVGKKYIDMYKGKFDMGWDKARETIFAKQMAMKILPAGTKLSNGIPHNESLVLNGMQASLEENMKHYDEWGGPNTYPPELLPAHVSVGYWWQNTQSSILLLDKYSCDFVSHPNKRMYRTGSTASLCAVIARPVMRGVRTLQERA